MEDTVKIIQREYWGPSKDYLFEDYKYLPFAPFNRLEKLGKVCDFSQKVEQKTYGGGHHQTSYQQQNNTQNQQDQTFEADNDFQEVQSKTQIKQKTTQQVYKKKPVQYYQRQPQVREKQATQQAIGKKQQLAANRYRYQVRATKTKFIESYLIKSEWQQLETIQKANFEPFNVKQNVQIETLHQTGYMRQYNKAFDKTNIKNEKFLEVQESLTLPITTSIDKTMIKIIKQFVGDESVQNKINIFCYDNILTSLMTLQNSNFPYEISVRKMKNVIILDKPTQDKAKNQASYIDLMTVNENSNYNLPDEEKEMFKLCLEATNVNKNFQKQVSAKDGEIQLGDSQSDDKKEGYKYQKINIDNEVNVVVRCQIDQYVQKEEEEQECLVRAFNEYDLDLEQWRNKFESNKGASEMEIQRNNTCKLFKWLCQAELTQVDLLKIGYISRVPNQKQIKHAILDVETYTTKQLLQTFNFKLKDGWTIIKYIAHMFGEQKDGEYMLIKVPYQHAIKVYYIPEDKDQDDQ